MGDKQRIINEVAERLKNYHPNQQIEDYLHSEGIDEAAFAGIMESAHAQMLQDKVKYFGKRNKRVFIAWLSAAFLTLVLFLFVLPYKMVAGYETFLSLLGTALFCLFCFLALAYNKSWQPAVIEKQDKPNINFSFLVIFLIPAVVVYFIFSWRFTSGQNTVLKETQEKAMGTIVTGKSTSLKRLRGGGIDFSEVTVSFQTKDGTNIVTTEDVTSYEFKNFYTGQKIELIYSKDNPRNIDLLVNPESVKELTGSEERELTVQDLLDLMTGKKETILNSLNKIKYGWQYDEKNGGWVNEKTGSVIVLNNDELMYVSGNASMFTYPKQFVALGFAQTNPEQQGAARMIGKKMFENAQYTASISMVANQGEERVVTTIQKK